MHLTVYRPSSDEVSIDDPTADDVARAVAEMGEESCVMLGRDEDTFLQVCVGPDEPLVLEYQAGGVDQFYVAHDEITPQAAAAALQDYLAGGESWENDFHWEQVNLLAYLNADFTMLTYVGAEVLEEGGLVDFEEFYEMPYIGLHQLITLYQVLTDDAYEALEPEFEPLGEAGIDEEHNAVLYAAPERLFLELEQMPPERVPDCAQAWWETEYFPQSVAEVEDVEELLVEIVKIARKSAANSAVLLICEVSAVEEDEEDEEDEDVEEGEEL